MLLDLQLSESPSEPPWFVPSILQGSNFWSDNGGVVFRGNPCTIVSWDSDTVMCDTNTDLDARVDMVYVQRAGNEDFVVFDLAADRPAVPWAGDSTIFIITAVSCSGGSWPESPNTCFMDEHFLRVSIRVSFACCPQMPSMRGIPDAAGCWARHESELFGVYE